MKWLLQMFPAGHMVISVMFIVSAFALLGFAGIELVHAVLPFTGRVASARIDGLLDCIALLTIAVASLELGQTIVEEEIQRASHMSSPSRVTSRKPSDWSAQRSANCSSVSGGGIVMTPLF